MVLNKVDLPQPDGPITARNSPEATLNDTLSSAVRLPSAVAKRITMFSTTRIAGAAACGSGIARSLVERLAIFGAILGTVGRSISSARHRRGHGGGIAGLDAHIDDGHLAGINSGD